MSAELGEIKATLLEAVGHLNGSKPKIRMHRSHKVNVRL